MDRAVFQVIPDLIGDHDGAIVLGFRGGCAQMRQHDDARVIFQPIGRKVANVGLQLARFQRREQRFLIHHALARKIQQDQMGLGVFQQRRVDQLAGGVV